MTPPQSVTVVFTSRLVSAMQTCARFKGIYKDGTCGPAKGCRRSADTQPVPFEMPILHKHTEKLWKCNATQLFLCKSLCSSFPASCIRMENTTHAKALSKPVNFSRAMSSRCSLNSDHCFLQHTKNQDFLWLCYSLSHLLAMCFNTFNAFCIPGHSFPSDRLFSCSLRTSRLGEAIIGKHE